MDLYSKAKSVFDTVGGMTEDFIYDQKCNIRIARVCAELKKAYEKLGRLSFRKLKGLKVDDNEFDAAVEKVEALKIELVCLREGKVEEPEFESIVFEDGEPVDIDANAKADADATTDVKTGE